MNISSITHVSGTSQMTVAAAAQGSWSHEVVSPEGIGRLAVAGTYRLRCIRAQGSQDNMELVDPDGRVVEVFSGACNGNTVGRSRGTSIALICTGFGDASSKGMPDLDDEWEIEVAE